MLHWLVEHELEWGEAGSNDCLFMVVEKWFFVSDPSDKIDGGSSEGASDDFEDGSDDGLPGSANDESSPRCRDDLLFARAR